MIESYYWKEELQRVARTLKRVKKPKRWSERAHCVVERDLMIGFFIVRRLIELHKISSLTRNYKMKVFSSPCKVQSINRMNGPDLDTSYDLETEKAETKTPLYISNQFIHAYISYVARDISGNWNDVFIVSDYDRHNCIWRVPVTSIRDLFLVVSRDYPHSLLMHYNEKKRDYDVSTN